jgi:hypothetical protein
MKMKGVCTMYHLVVFFLFGIFNDVQNHPYRKSFQICDQFSRVMDCYYFSCIDSIYQCGSKNLLVQFSYHFCKFVFSLIKAVKQFFSGEATLERTYSSLTRSGQSWANATQKCLMQELDYLLKTNPSLTCTELDRYIINKYPICLAQSHPVLSLCTIVCNNLEIFFEIFENWNLINLNLKRLLLETSYLCPEKSQMEYVIDIEQSNIRKIFWSLCLDSLKTKFRNFHPNEVMIRINENSGMFAEIIEEEN